MNPALWSTLPVELLQRVFARLPLPDICPLKSVSKEWKQSLETSGSEFTLAFKEASSPSIFALVTWDARSNFWEHIFDGRTDRWHALHVSVVGTSTRRWVHMKGAADAGLVCYVSKELEAALRVFMINPMTGDFNPLPDLQVLTYTAPIMLQIVVDPKTYHYKVIVVGFVERALEVYDSEVQQWNPKPEQSLSRIFGYAHHWSVKEGLWTVYDTGPCAYDCREGRYYDFRDDRETWLGSLVQTYALMKDRLFVLHRETQHKQYTCISEYCVPKSATSWVKVKIHSCFLSFVWPPILPGLRYRIHACNGFPIVFVFIKENPDPNPDPNGKLKRGWLYNLATCEWRAPPPGSMGDGLSF